MMIGGLHTIGGAAALALTPEGLWLSLGWTSAGIVLAGLVMTLVNLRYYRKHAGDEERPGERITVCIPARNEVLNLRACVEGVAANGPDVRVLVYDDQSTDDTPRLLDSLCAEHPNVTKAPTTPLPPGWNGKQHACWRMAQRALDEGADWLLFTDADVRFAPTAVSTAARAARVLKADLVSTFPRQATGTFAEHVAVPMIFFILFSYLPFARMRRTNDPASSAGCGQFLLISARAYRATDGHAAFRDSMHDGIKLPREVRRAGYHTDLFDGTDEVSCRMYRGFSQTWRGFAKNAYEGLGSVGLLLFVTVMHAVGHVLPWGVLVAAAAGVRFPTLVVWLAAGAVGLALVQRLVLAARLRTSWMGAVLHPVGILMMTAIQWHSFVLHATGKRAWRGRVQLANGRSQIAK